MVILWYVLNHPLSTYEDVYSGLVALGYKIKQATCVGRLSDMSTRQEKPFLDMERDGKMTRYRINDEGVKYLEGKQ